MRVRFTIDGERWKRACEYAELTHRSPAELVAEALEQMQARYPKGPRFNANDEERMIERILTRIASTVPAGTFSAKKGACG